MGVMHGDLKADNVCIPVQAGYPHAPHVAEVRLIDFAFSLSRDYPLRFVLPSDPDRIDYLPEFYKNAIKKAQQHQQPASIQQVCCAEVDLFSLGIMLEKIIGQAGLEQTRQWPTLAQLIDHCKAKGSRQPSRLGRWIRRDFARPTRAALSPALRSSLNNTLQPVI